MNGWEGTAVFGKKREKENDEFKLASYVICKSECEKLNGKTLEI
jgi:hypothetical protein